MSRKSWFTSEILVSNAKLTLKQTNKQTNLHLLFKLLVRNSIWALILNTEVELIKTLLVLKMSFLPLSVDNDMLVVQFSGQTKQTENNFGLGRNENILFNPEQKGLFWFLVMHQLENQI